MIFIDFLNRIVSVFSCFIPYNLHEYHFEDRMWLNACHKFFHVDNDFLSQWTREINVDPTLSHKLHVAQCDWVTLASMKTQSKPNLTQRIWRIEKNMKNKNPKTSTATTSSQRWFREQSENDNLLGDRRRIGWRSPGLHRVSPHLRYAWTKLLKLILI